MKSNLNGNQWSNHIYAHFDTSNRMRISTAKNNWKKFRIKIKNNSTEEEKNYYDHQREWVTQPLSIFLFQFISQTRNLKKIQTNEDENIRFFFLIFLFLYFTKTTVRCSKFQFAACSMSRTCKTTFPIFFFTLSTVRSNPRTVQWMELCVARTIRTDREWTNEWGTVGARGSHTVFRCCWCRCCRRRRCCCCYSIMCVLPALERCMVYARLYQLNTLSPRGM